MVLLDLVLDRLRLFGRSLLLDTPFGEAFLRPAAQRILGAVTSRRTTAGEARSRPAAVHEPHVALLGDVTELDTMARAMTDGFGFVAMARALLRQPDLVRRYAATAAAMTGDAALASRVGAQRLAGRGHAGGGDGEVTVGGSGGGKLGWHGAHAMATVGASMSGGQVASTCDHCNLCIVGATMAEQPLRCVLR